MMLTTRDLVSACNFRFSNNYVTDQLMQAGWKHLDEATYKLL